MGAHKTALLPALVTSREPSGHRIQRRVIWLRTYTVYASDTNAAAQSVGPPQTRRKDHAMAQRAKKIAEENSHHDCDFRDMLSRVGDKWSLLVIFILKGRPAFRARFSDLKRSIPGISQRMLTATVRNLERDGMLTRHVYAEVPPRVEYELTPLGRGLTEPVLGLVSWLQSNWPVIRSARDRFDARKQVTRTVARPGSATAIRG